MSDVCDKLEACGARVQRDVVLASSTSFHIGGPARYFVMVDSDEQLLCSLDAARDFGLDVCVLGGGSNVLVSDDGFDGMVIALQIADVRFEGGSVHVGAGVATAQLAGMCVAHGLSGMEWAVGIPGRIGGALVGNAGAMGGEMKDVVRSVRSVEIASGAIVERDVAACEFEYRGSIFKRVREIIVSCVIELAPAADVDALQRALRDNLTYRNTTQPKRYGSSGCMFKNYVPQGEDFERLRSLAVPPNMLDARRVSAGWLIDRAGCKGMRVGDAMVSREHGNFIVNMGGATARDVVALAQQVRERVRDVFGVELEDEVRYIGSK